MLNLALSALLVVAGVSAATAADVAYLFNATMSNGIAVSGQVTVDNTNPGYAPGGTVEFVSGGVTSFAFSATNGITTEVIDTALIAVPTPQTIRMTFSVASFPAVESWDFSCSNEWTGGVLYQFVTVHSPSNSGFEQWAGSALHGSAFPSNGTWTTGTVSAVESSFGSVKTLFR